MHADAKQIVAMTDAQLGQPAAFTLLNDMVDQANHAYVGEIDPTTGEVREGVTWIHSYVSDDGTKTFCVYDAPTPEAIRKTAARNELPVDHITQIRVLDPYFYVGSTA